MAAMDDHTGDGRTVRAVLFDLDGTLTRPVFDFDAIRREIGLPTQLRMPVLEALEQMTPQARCRAEEILLRHEQDAAGSSELWEDVHVVLARLRAADIRLGLLTRNSRLSADTVMRQHGLTFDLVRTRDDGVVKPHPESVLAMCRQLAVTPAETWVVGDYLFDLQCGNGAGATSVLMIGDADPPDFADQARHVIRRLTELCGLMGIGSDG